MSGNVTTGRGWLTVPVLFFHEGEGLTVSVETKCGTLYRGRADRTEDNFSVSLSDVTVTSPKGVVSSLQRVYIRGSRIVFVVFPSVLERAPIFDRVRRLAEGKVVAGGLGASRQMAIQNKQARQMGGMGPPGMGPPGMGPPGMGPPGMPHGMLPRGPPMGPPFPGGPPPPGFPPGMMMGGPPPGFFPGGPPPPFPPGVMGGGAPRPMMSAMVGPWGPGGPAGGPPPGHPGFGPPPPPPPQWRPPPPAAPGPPGAGRGTDATKPAWMTQQ